MKLNYLYTLTCLNILEQKSMEYTPKLVSDLSGNSNIKNYFGKSHVFTQPPTTKGQGGFQGSIGQGALLPTIGKKEPGRLQKYFGGALK